MQILIEALERREESARPRGPIRAASNRSTLRRLWPATSAQSQDRRCAPGSCCRCARRSVAAVGRKRRGRAAHRLRRLDTRPSQQRALATTASILITAAQPELPSPPAEIRQTRPELASDDDRCSRYIEPRPHARVESLPNAGCSGQVDASLRRSATRSTQRCSSPGDRSTTRRRHPRQEFRRSRHALRPRREVDDDLFERRMA